MNHPNTTPKAGPTPDKKPSDERTDLATLRGTLTLDLPMGQDALELIVEAAKWRRVVQEHSAALRNWSELDADSGVARGYYNALQHLRILMADCGLTFYSAKVLSEMHHESMTRYWDEYVDSVNARIGGRFKDE